MPKALKKPPTKKPVKVSWLTRLVMKFSGKKIPSETESAPGELDAFLDDTKIHKPNWIEKQFMGDPGFKRARIWMIVGIFISGFAPGALGLSMLMFFHFVFTGSFIAETHIEMKMKAKWKYKALFLRHSLGLLNVTSAFNMNYVNKLDIVRMDEAEHKKHMEKAINTRRAAEITEAIREFDDSHNKWKR